MGITFVTKKRKVAHKRLQIIKQGKHRTLCDRWHSRTIGSGNTHPQWRYVTCKRCLKMKKTT